MDIKTITSRLNAIRRTLLFCNSPEEFANKVGVPSLVTNNNFDKVGTDKRVAIYQALNDEYQTYTKSDEDDLDEMLDYYEQTSAFYTANELSKNTILSQRDNILKIMECLFVSHELPGHRKLNKFLSEIYNPERDQIRIPGLEPCILILLLFKAIPTYNSKRGSVPDIESDYRRVCSLLQDFHDRHAKTEQNLRKIFFERRLKNGEITLNRLAIITLFQDTLYARDSINDLDNIQQSYRYYDITGVWLDKKSGKDIIYDIYLNLPFYGMDIYEFYSTEVKYSRYIVEIISEDDNLLFCTTHPIGRAKLLQNIKLDVLDYSFHYVTFDDYEYPKEIILTDKQRHPNYDFNVSRLCRADDDFTADVYERLESIKQTDKFDAYKTEYIPGSRIYAITLDYIYIISPEDNPDSLYKISRDKYIDEHISRINVDDLGGVAVIAKKGPYIGFEKIGLYIDISSEEKIQEAGIEIVKMNEIV